MRHKRSRRFMLCMAGVLVAGACGAAVVAPAQALSATTPSASVSPPLCKDLAHLDGLVVRRSDAFPQNHLRFSFPASVTVNKAAYAREAARALCALPDMPAGTFHCPADFGITYHLSFSAGEELAIVSVDPSGCEEVRGLGATRWVARTPGFWRVLGNAMGLPGATQGTFAGTMGSAPLFPCAASAVRVVASTDRPSYGPGETVRMTSSITNISKSPCAIWLGYFPTLVVTNSAGAEVWDRCWVNDEPGACALFLVVHRLDPGRTYKETARWDQRSGKASKPPAQVPPGRYRFATQYASFGRASVSFVLGSS